MLKRLLVAAVAVAALVAPSAVRADSHKDIVDTAVAAGSFKTLAAALQAAGLIDTLKGKGPFTVFAPTDEAFAKIPKAALDALIADKAKLTKVLTYHVVAGKVMAADVVKLKEAKTLQGQMVKIDASSGVMVNNAKVVKADVGSFQRRHSRDRHRPHAPVARTESKSASPGVAHPGTRASVVSMRTSGANGGGRYGRQACGEVLTSLR